LPPVNNYPFSFPFNDSNYRGDWPAARIDHNLTQKNSLFGRWMMRQTPFVLYDGLPNLVWTRLRRDQQYVVGDTHVFSSQLLNSFRFGLSFDRIVDGQPEAGKKGTDGTAALASTGLLGSNPSGLTGQGFPAINISGLTSLSDVPGGEKSDVRILNISDSVDWQVERHTLKFGFNIQRDRIFQGAIPDYGTFNFDGSITGNAYADFLLGLPQNSQRTNPLINRSLNDSEMGVYAEDDFKVKPRLTLSYGLRWDYYATPTAADHLMYNWDDTTGNLVVDPRAISKISPLYPSTIAVSPGSVTAISDKTNFVPRLGAAYRLTNHSVLRGGYGIYTSRLGSGGVFNDFYLINPQLGSTGPFAISESYLNVVKPGQQPLLQFPDPYPASTALASVPSQSVVGYPRQSHNGRIQQFSVSFEQEIASIGLRASYVGSRSSGLNYQVNVNLPHPSTNPFTASARPFPQFVSTYLVRYDGGAKYDGLQLEAKRRIGSIQFDANYTLARSIANYLDTENPYDVLSHWANDGPTRRHYATISANWELPFGKGHRILAHGPALVQKIAVDNLSLYSITYLGSGYWFSPSYSGSDPSNTGTFGGLPDRIGNPNAVPGGRTRQEWFNTAAFAVPQPGHFGNALPYSLENQSLYVTHLGLVKVAPLGERVKFYFTAQVSNLLNHPEFLPPSGNISVAGGAQFTSQVDVFSSLERATPRQTTFSGAFRF
jgi:hypothetical protein